MSLLDFESSGPGPKGGKKSLKLVLGIGALAGVITLSSTLAASINLNGGDDVEFGQGVVMTTACDPEITITPFSTFINAQGGGEHRLSSIRLSGIDSSEGACEGKTFRVRAYGDGPDPLDLFKWEDGTWNDTDDDSNWDYSDYNWTERDRYDFVDINRTDETFLWTSDGTDNDDVINIGEDPITESAFTINFVSVALNILRTPLVSTDVLRKITVETFDATTTIPSAWNDIAWNTGDSAGPFVFANSLTNGKPDWLNDENISELDFSYEFSSNGMGMGGNNGPGFPYATLFDISSTAKVTIQFHFKYDEEDYDDEYEVTCPDHGVVIFPTGTIPSWSWDETYSSGLIARWNCGLPEVAGTTGISESGVRLSVGTAYIGVLTYDPNVSINQLVLATKELDGTVISLASLSEVLTPGTDYRIGFSADRDSPSGYSYFKNLIITIEPAT